MKKHLILSVIIILFLNPGEILAQKNPMGKTWVVYIENSEYDNLADLEGPAKDAVTLKNGLYPYDIKMIIHKINLTKTELEEFFSSELKEHVLANKVKSLMIWYAGHGAFITDTGYWIPVDARENDESSYVSVKSILSSLKQYTTITHMLVVNDASQAGVSFYAAMRSAAIIRTCEHADNNDYASAQIFSSAGREDAADNSVFATAFYRALINNKNYCLPIEEIVGPVIIAVTSNEQQKPKFGKIAGLKDENGTFFFIKRKSK